MPLHICQITDSHLGSLPGTRLNDVDTDASLARVTAAILDRHPRTDIILATGDLVHDGSAAGYRRFRATTATLQRPVYCLPGNHDAPAVMASHLDTEPFSCARTLSRNGWQIILLDSTCAGRSSGVLSTAELEYLHATLGGNDVPALVCLHHQPVPIDSPWMDDMGLENGKAFMDIVERTPRVRAVLWGHVHQAFDTTRHGVRLLGSPSTCFQFRPRSTGFALDAGGPAYRWLELHADGRLETGIEWCP